MTARRDRDAAATAPLWIQVYGATTNRDESQSFTSSGFTQTIVTDYNQDYFGWQMGYEFGPGGADDGPVFGVTGGYLNSTQNFVGTFDRTTFDAFNIGVYLGYQSGGFFANGLAKYDFLDADIRSTTEIYRSGINGDAYGVRAELGYRLEGSHFFAEPVVSIEYQSSGLDDYSVLGATIDFERFTGLRGQAGVRLGGEASLGSNTLVYYAGAHAVHEFAGDDGVTFTSGVSTIRLTNDPLDTFGRFELGVNIATIGGVTGFIEGNTDIGDDYQGFGGRAGLRIPF